jgi:hypothetical protein
MNFLEFIKEKKNIRQSFDTINEDFRSSDMNKVFKLIKNCLNKKISNYDVIELKGIDVYNIENKAYYVKQYLVLKDSKGYTITFNFKSSSNEIVSVSIFDGYDILWKNKTNARLTINTLGTSIAKIIPLICEIINKNLQDISSEEATKMLTRGIKETYYDIDQYTYIIYEGTDDDDNEAIAYAKKKKQEYTDAFYDGKHTDAEIRQLADEYAKVITAINQDGAKTVEEIKVSIQKRTQFEKKEDESVIKAEEKLKKSRKDPEQVFKEMSKYIDLVIKGLQTSVIICGAPGVGKTFKVRQQLKKAGYKEGENLYTYKGKGTPRALYLTLFNYKDKGDIVVIDDADALVGPKAPEDSINILKAALDSTSDEEGRLVSYGIGTKLVDDNGKPIQKKFYYNGGVIVITNYNVGQLDSALRGRSFIQDINFTIEETLGIIKKLIPEIEPDKYSPESKQKAFNFLEELSKDEEYSMNISVRIFCLCAKLFESCAHDDDFNDDDVKSMIKEQMKNQAAEGGKKY